MASDDNVKLDENGIPTSEDGKVTTAVEFLGDVYQKGYEEADLRKYLVHKRGLASPQVDEAFRIHKLRMAKMKQKARQEKPQRGTISRSGSRQERPERRKPADRPERPSNKSPERPSNHKSPERPSNHKSAHGRRMSNNAERAEKVTGGAKKAAPTHNVLGFLKKNRQAAGGKVIKEFLKTEWNYCTILECLKQEYYKELAEMSGKNKFRMTRKEVDEIFRRVPELLKFHKVFYTDLNRGSNIGRMFVRLFNFFKGYVEYMKDCTATIDKMREYTRDKKLHKALGQIRQRSSRQKDDMVDLLLVPLDRIMDYKEFLDKLLDWADESQTQDYDFLGKAARRIGRVAKYIEKYKYGISNRNEMNKVQQFLDKQCDILAPHRRIVRRGMMIRRTTGWAPRNKHYIFFLFNDVLLWTTKKRELQNVVQLRNCEAMPSDQKTNPNRKFKIISRGQRHKTLLLECTSERQRDEWYKATLAGIKAAKETSAQAWSKTELSGLKKAAGQNDDSDEDDISTAIAKGAPTKEDVVQAVVAAPPPPQKGYVDDRDSPVGANAPEDRRDRQLDRERHPDDMDDQTTPRDTYGHERPGHEREESMYDDRYEYSTNFKNQEFKEFDPMDDTVSQISEYDQQFYEQNRHYDDVKNASTGDVLSPFRNPKQDGKDGPHKRRPSGDGDAQDAPPDIFSRGHFEDGGAYEQDEQEERERPTAQRRSSPRKMLAEQQRSKAWNQERESREEESPRDSKGSSIIRRYSRGSSREMGVDRSPRKREPPSESKRTASNKPQTDDSKTPSEGGSTKRDHRRNPSFTISLGEM